MTATNRTQDKTRMSGYAKGSVQPVRPEKQNAVKSVNKTLENILIDNTASSMTEIDVLASGAQQ